MSDPKRCGTAPDECRCVGPLASHIDGFVAQLERDGYAPTTVRAKCAFLAEISGRLEALGLSLDALGERDLGRLYPHRRVRLRRGAAATVNQMLRYLRDLGWIQ